MDRKASTSYVSNKQQATMDLLRRSADQPSITSQVYELGTSSTSQGWQKGDIGSSGRPNRCALHTTTLGLKTIVSSNLQSVDYNERVELHEASTATTVYNLYRAWLGTPSLSRSMQASFKTASTGRQPFSCTRQHSKQQLPAVHRNSHGTYPSFKVAFTFLPISTLR